MADPALPQPHNGVHLRKKRKKSRYLKQGCYKSERDDHRRIAARAFLSGITRDSHLGAQPSRGQAPAPEEDENASSFVSAAPSRKRSIVPVGDAPSPPSTPVLEAHYSPTFKRFAELHHGSNQQLAIFAVGTSKSLDQVVESHSYHQLAGIRTSQSADYADPATEHRPSLLHVATKWPSTAEGVIYENTLPTTHYYDSGRSSR